MYLESASLDLLLPHLVMNLNIVEDGVDQALDVRILVTKQLEHDRHHLGLMENNIARCLEEEELEECVEDLLNHFIVFLLCSKQILQHLDQVRLSNCLSCNL